MLAFILTVEHLANDIVIVVVLVVLPVGLLDFEVLALAARIDQLLLLAAHFLEFNYNYTPDTSAYSFH